MTIIEFPIKRATVVTGVVLLVLPLLALGLKALVPGVLLMFVLYGAILIGGAYVLWAVMVSSGFFGRRAAFSFVDSRRARVAGWMHGFSLLAAAFFITDGNDSRWTSPFLTIFSLTAADTSDSLAAAALFVAIASYVWFFVEWLFAVRTKRRLV